MTYACRFLDAQQFRAVEDQRLALAKSRDNDKEWLATNNAPRGWARLEEITGPCVMWHAPWFFDPTNPEHRPRRAAALQLIIEGHKSYLSRFYWQQWSDKRPPICVLCPNGKEWCVDARSSNGEGWEVMGEPPCITCVPSIQVPGYHGFLRDGIFTPNM